SCGDKENVTVKVNEDIRLNSVSGSRLKGGERRVRNGGLVRGKVRGGERVVRREGVKIGKGGGGCGVWVRKEGLKKGGKKVRKIGEGVGDSEGGR
uniref:hypothetical protein n=1 Tax=Neisseria sicca TaxID=490 RepID=UPI001C9A23AC